MSKKNYKYTNLINETLQKTAKEKTATAIFNEYIAGRFCSIPFDLFDTTEEKDLEELKKIYEECVDQKVQLVPTGLYNLRDIKERNRFIGALEKKVNSGVFLLWDAFIVDIDMPKDGRNKLLQIITKAHKFESNAKFPDFYIKALERNEKTNLKLEIQDAETKQLFEECEQKEEIFRNKQLSVDVSKKYKSKRKLDDIYPMYVEFFQKRYEKEFARIDRCFAQRNVLDGNREYATSKFYTYGIKDSLNVEEDQKARENKKSQKEILLSVIKILSNLGVIDDLLKDENQNITDINKLINKDMLPIDTKEKLIERINSIDISKKEGALQLDAYMMHFFSKYAGIYEQLSQVCFGICVGGNDVVKRHHEIYKEYAKETIKELCQKYIDDPSEFNYKLLYKVLKNSIKPKGTKGFIKANINKNNENLEDMINLLVDKEFVGFKGGYKVFDNVMDLSKDIYATFEGFIKEYNELINRDRKNSSYVPTFKEFFEEILKTYESEKNKSAYECKTISEQVGDHAPLFGEDELNAFLNRLEKGYNEKGKGLPFLESEKSNNLTRRIITKIWEIEGNRMFTDPLPTLKMMCDDIIYKDNLYDIRDFFLKSIVEVYRKNPEMVSVRNNVETNNNYGNIDVALPEIMQFFRKRYKVNELSEEERIFIESIPKIKPERGMLFGLKESSMIRCYIPQDKLTLEQSKIFDELYRYFASKGNVKTENINESAINKNVNKTLAKVIKLKLSLAKGIAKYRQENTLDEKETEISNGQEEEMSETLLEVLENSNMQPEKFFSKFLKVKSKSLLNLCLKKLRLRTIEREIKCDLEKNQNHKLVSDTIENDHLGMVISYQGSTQEGTKLQNEVRRQSDLEQDVHNTNSKED